MAKQLTPYQRKLKQRLEELLLNFGFQQELGYLRRDTSSLLKTTETQGQRDKRLRQLMEKFGIELDFFFILQRYCSSGEFNYSLIGSMPRTKTYAKRDQLIYSMWLHQGMKIKQITQNLRSEGWDIDLQYVSKIVKRKRAEDPNPTSNYGPRSANNG